MKVITRLEMQWDEKIGEYRTVETLFYQYDGPVALLCGASSQEKGIEKQQSQFSEQLVNQATQVFGSSSKVFSSLMNTFMPTIAAGPSQKGFSATEEANLKSQAITQSGVAYKNAKAAVGNAQAAQGGGNTGLISGAEIGTDANLAESGAENTANQLGRITEANYETGRQNYYNAVQGMEKSTDVFNPATGAAGAATGQQAETAKTASDISAQNNSWMQAVSGALGAVGGAVMTGGMSNLGKGVGFFGQNANAPK